MIGEREGEGDGDGDGDADGDGGGGGEWEWERKRGKVNELSIIFGVKFITCYVLNPIGTE